MITKIHDNIFSIGYPSALDQSFAFGNSGLVSKLGPRLRQVVTQVNGDAVEWNVVVFIVVVLGLWELIYSPYGIIQNLFYLYL